VSLQVLEAGLGGGGMSILSAFSFPAFWLDFPTGTGPELDEDDVGVVPNFVKFSLKSPELCELEFEFPIDKILKRQLFMRSQAAFNS
jgi:hypothetical protein